MHRRVRGSIAAMAELTAELSGAALKQLSSFHLMRHSALTRLSPTARNRFNATLQTFARLPQPSSFPSMKNYSPNCGRRSGPNYEVPVLRATIWTMNGSAAVLSRPKWLARSSGRAGLQLFSQTKIILSLANAFARPRKASANVAFIASGDLSHRLKPEHPPLQPIGVFI